MALISNPSNPNQNNPVNPGSVQPTIQQRRGTGFTNLNKILQANQQNKLGEAVGGGVTQQAQTAKQTISGAQQDFGKQADSVRQGLQQAQQFAGQTLQNVAQTGQEANVSDEDAQKFADIRAAQYQGPTELSNADAVKRSSMEASQLGQLTGSAGGREYLLQRFAANPGTAYGSGARQLDMALLGKQGGQALKEARRSSVGLESQADEALNLAREQGKTLQSQTTGLADDVNNQINAQRDPLLQQLSERKASEETKFNQDKARIQDALSRGEISAADAEKLGLNDVSNLYDVDLNQYVNSSITPASELGVASREEAARANALAKLSGNDALGNVDQSGNFLQNQFTTNKAQLQDQISRRAQQYNSERNTVLADSNYKFLNDSQQGLKHESDRIGSEQEILQAGKVAAQNGDRATAQAKIIEFMQKTGRNPVDEFGNVRWNEMFDFLDKKKKEAEGSLQQVNDQLNPYNAHLNQIDTSYNSGRKLNIT